MIFSEKNVYVIARIRELNLYDTALYFTVVAADFTKVDCLGSDFASKSIDHCLPCEPATIIVMMQFAQQDQIPGVADATG